MLILEDEVYDDPAFKEQLADAVRSMDVGSAWDPATKMGPVIRKPNEALEYALTTIEEGETWVVEPKQLDDNPQLFSPGVKWGVQRGSQSHLTEFFGPVLGVMRAKNLLQAIDRSSEESLGHHLERAGYVGDVEMMHGSLDAVTRTQLGVRRQLLRQRVTAK